MESEHFGGSYQEPVGTLGHGHLALPRRSVNRLGMRTAAAPLRFRFRIIGGLVALLYSLTFASLAWPVAMPTPMAIFAHRGDLEHWPEDTLESVLAASRTDVDGIEFDIRKSADGTWWLLHDPTLDVTTDGSGSIASHTDAQLAALTVDRGPGFSGQRGVRLTRLSAVLDALRGYRGTLIVDVKELDPASHGEVARLAPAGSYIICRSIAGASAVKAVDSGLTTLMLRNEVWHPDVDVWLAEAGSAIRWPGSTFTDALGTMGMYVDVSTDGRRTDELELLEKGRRWGVAFVISNRVDEALAAR